MTNFSGKRKELSAISALRYANFGDLRNLESALTICRSGWHARMYNARASAPARLGILIRARIFSRFFISAGNFRVGMGACISGMPEMQVCGVSR
jgi:hypothetical protein